jgi:hypothetical protein
MAGFLPRDAILYLNLCVREATGKDKMSWENIHQAERAYSNERLLALRDEWKDPYLGIEKLFEKFQRKPAKLSETGITEILDEIALLPAEMNFLESKWLTTICEPIYSGESAKKTWYEIYGQLVSLLYNIGFIGIAKGPHGRAQYSYENPGLSELNGNIPDKAWFKTM